MDNQQHTPNESVPEDIPQKVPWRRKRNARSRIAAAREAKRRQQGPVASLAPLTGSITNNSQQQATGSNVQQQASDPPLEPVTTPQPHPSLQLGTSSQPGTSSQSGLSADADDGELGTSSRSSLSADADDRKLTRGHESSNSEVYN